MTPTELRAELAKKGFSVFTPAASPANEAESIALRARRSPWLVARELFDEAPVMVEMQPIEPREGARSFAATRIFTPLHTDSQSHLGTAPNAIVMCCLRPAALDLGTPLVADAWALASRITATDPALFEALVTVPRRIPFLFGDVWGPTLAIRGARDDANAPLVFTHSPIPPQPGDAIAQALGPHVRAMPTTALLVRAGDVLVIDNHRMLHGRTAFEASAHESERSFVRLLVWLPTPFGTDDALARHTKAVAGATDVALAKKEEPPWVRARFGRAIGATPTGADARRLAIVLEMLRGAPPGMLAAREGVAEPELYRWRDAVMTAAASSLATLPEAKDADDALAATLARVRS